MKLIGAAALALLLLLDAAADPRPWAWLGVRIRDMSEQEMEEISRRHGIREGFGVVIVEVLADSPAAGAGLKNGDVVVAPIRSGIGFRLGANVGYLKYTRWPTWNPF